MHRIHTPPLIAAISLMAACSGSPEHSGFTTLDPDGWIYGDTVRYTPAASDSSYRRECDVIVVVRNNNSYEYSNLWLRLDYQGSDSTRTDTLNVVLADDLGNWLGKGIGGSYQLTDTVLRSVELDLAGEIKVTHIMRTDTLEGIEQIGIIVTEQTLPDR